MEIRYSKTHEWAAKEGELYICGLSDYAQDKVGDIVFVELPETGAEAEQGAPFGVIESVKAANDLYSPLSGEVVEVNWRPGGGAGARSIPPPLKKGWICKIKSER